MKVAILAGGVGSRLAEETEKRPKPMVEIGGVPILWHIMRYYAHFGHRGFAIALGYEGELHLEAFNIGVTTENYRVIELARLVEEIVPGTQVRFADNAGPDPRYPLEVLVCNACGLAQLRHTVAPEALFDDDYPHFSSYSQTVVDNARANVEQALARFAPPPDALVVEIASNDGYLLKHVAARGFRTLGIDPASGPVAAARAAGIETLHAFFTEALAAELAASGRQADLVFGNNVLAHVADTGGFVRGIARLLKPGGTAIIEAPYLRDLIEHGEFDTICHEHLCYFSVTALRQLFARHGLALNDVERIPIHGGSIRLFVQHANAPTPRMLALLAEEHALDLDGPGAFRRFAERTEVISPPTARRPRAPSC